MVSRNREANLASAGRRFSLARIACSIAESPGPQKPRKTVAKGGTRGVREADELHPDDAEGVEVPGEDL